MLWPKKTNRSIIFQMESAINLKNIKANLSKYSKSFKNAKPYPHLVIENFFKKRASEKMYLEFPTVAQMQMSSAFSGVAEKKNQLSDTTKMSPIFRQVFRELMSPEFRKIVASISGIDPVLPDQDLAGGGLHQGSSGSFLDIHADFNKHPVTGKYRRLNILIYLNKNWKSKYGGNLEMWDKDMTKCEKSVAPIFNRCLIFATDKYSHHGYAKMDLPDGVTRKSLAAYYYSNAPAPGEDEEFHNTLFKARPGELRNKILYPLITSKVSQKIRTLIRKFL